MCSRERWIRSLIVCRRNSSGMRDRSWFVRWIQDDPRKLHFHFSAPRRSSLGLRWCHRQKCKSESFLSDRRRSISDYAKVRGMWKTLASGVVSAFGSAANNQSRHGIIIVVMCNKRRTIAETCPLAQKKHTFQSLNHFAKRCFHGIVSLESSSWPSFIIIRNSFAKLEVEPGSANLAILGFIDRLNNRRVCKINEDPIIAQSEDARGSANFHRLLACGSSIAFH